MEKCIELLIRVLHGRRICSLSIFLFVLMAFSPLTVLGQDNQGRNADEQHAWRLYEQYKQVNDKIGYLERAIVHGNKDMKDVAYGMWGGLAIDPTDVSSVNKARAMLKKEQEAQKNLEAAWGKKFFGSYGDLKDCNQYIVEGKTKKKMDRIEFRLTYFPFKSGTDPVVGASSPEGTGAGTQKGIWDFVLNDNCSKNVRVQIAGVKEDNPYIGGNLRRTIMSKKDSRNMGGDNNAACGPVVIVSKSFKN